MNYQLKSAKVKISSAAAVIALVFGISLAGSSTTSATTMPMEGHSMSSTSQPVEAHHVDTQKANELRVAMNNLLREHVTSSLNVTHAIAGGESERAIEGAKVGQYANSDALAAAVGSIYGGAAQAQFSMLFREHIEQSNFYAEAIAAGDRTAADAANVELREYLEDISNFFVGAIPGLKFNEVYGLLNEHEELINKSTDAYKAGDYVQAYQMEREALKQVSIAADALSAGIVATNPDKF